MSFYLMWGASAFVLLIAAGMMGKSTQYGVLGVLVDHRGRYSLTHFQIVLWTIVIMSSTIGVLIVSKFDPASLGLTPQILGLMGISAGSAVLSTAVKGAKDGGATFIAAEGEILKDKKGNTLVNQAGGPRIVQPHFSQIWLEEEGVQAEKVINITKFQNFLFTLIILAFYVAITIKTSGLPVLPDNVEWLIGISHAGYVGGKMPNRG